MTMGEKRVIKLCHLDEGEILKRFIYKLARISPYVGDDKTPLCNRFKISEL